VQCLIVLHWPLYFAVLSCLGTPLKDSDSGTAALHLMSSLWVVGLAAHFVFQSVVPPVVWVER